jgi:preprotein translocase subunit SecA
MFKIRSPDALLELVLNPTYANVGQNTSPFDQSLLSISRQTPAVTEALKRIESFRRIIREQTLETDRKISRNRDSIKNILNPKIVSKPDFSFDEDVGTFHLSQPPLKQVQARRPIPAIHLSLT